MQTFIRLCLCILLGVPALLTLILALLFVYEMIGDAREHRMIAGTICREYLDIMKGEDVSTKNAYYDAIRNNNSLWNIIFDHKLAKSEGGYADVFDHCLENPQLTIRETLTTSPEYISQRLTEMLTDKQQRQNSSEEKRSRMERLNAPYAETTADIMGSEQASPTLNVSTTTPSPTGVR